LFEPLLLTSSIIPKDECSETIAEAVLEAINTKASHLDGWATVHEKMFSTTHDIPCSSEIHLSKMEGGLVTTDTCNSARLLGKILVDAVEFHVNEKRELEGINGNDNDNDVVAMIQDCHNHMRNVWIKAVTVRLSIFLNKALALDLKEISPTLRVTTMMDGIIRATEKGFSLTANYPKGDGDRFKHWLPKYHPSALLVPLERSAGSRMDLSTEGAGAIYWNRVYYVEYLDEVLRGGKDNILQENLWLVFTSVEMIALCRTLAILHFKICMPLRWLVPYR
jgi:hypothetical protein